MIPHLVRDVAKQLALGFAFRARQLRVSGDDVNELQAWALARLAENDYELLRTTKLAAVWQLVDRLLVEYRTLWVTPPHAIIRDVEHGLWVRVKCLDVEVGCATFARAVGLAYTTFEPSDDYPMIAPYAREIGEWLSVRHSYRSTDGDVADIVAAQWRGERLSLENRLGQELAVSHVIVTESPGAYKPARIQLVADFRPDHSRISAIVPTGDVGSGGRNRPR